MYKKCTVTSSYKKPSHLYLASLAIQVKQTWLSYRSYVVYHIKLGF